MAGEEPDYSKAKEQYMQQCHRLLDLNVKRWPEGVRVLDPNDAQDRELIDAMFRPPPTPKAGEEAEEQEGEGEGEDEAEGERSVGSDDPDGDDDDHPKWKHKRKPGETWNDFFFGDDPVPKKKKKKRGPGLEAKPMFEGSHAKVLAYYQELGNFTVEHSEIHDELLVKPRAVSKKGKKLNPKSFGARFGKHLRKLGFLAADDRNNLVASVAFYMPNYSQNPIDLVTLELPRNAAAENEAMLDADPFA